MQNLNDQGFDLEKSGFQVVFDDHSSFSNLDSINKKHKSAKMLLISGGYAYQDLVNHKEDEEYKVVQEENNLLNRLVKSDSKKYIGFAGINPLKNYALNEIKRCDEELGLHGVKLHLQSSRVDLSNAEHLRKLIQVFRECSKRKLSLLIHNNATNLDSGKEYVRIFIDSILAKVDPVTLLFAHSGGGGLYFNFTHDVLNGFNEYLNAAVKPRHQIYFELSGTVSVTHYPGERTMIEFEQMINTIGADHFLFGSDFPYRNSAAYIIELRQELGIQDSILKQIIEKNIFDTLKRR